MIVPAFAAVIALAGQPPATSPVTSPQEAPATQLDEVEVVGQRLQDHVARFIDEVTAPPRRRNLARWDRKICVGVVNLDNRYAQFMVDRVSERASAVGLEIGEPGCKANIMIAATDDPQGLATVLVQDNPNDFRPALGGTDMGARALARFQQSDAPIRWWYVSLPVSTHTGAVAIRLKNTGAPIIQGEPSRIRANVREDLARILVIMDMTKIGQISFSALSDYVAMVSLTQFDPEADASRFDSILSLFSSETPPQAMTGWDEDFIQALYSAPRDRARPSQQTRYIAWELRRLREREEQARAPLGDNIP